MENNHGKITLIYACVLVLLHDAKYMYVKYPLLYPSPVFRVFFLLFFLIFKAVTINSYKEDNCFTAVRKRDKVLESGHLFVSRII